MSREAARIVAAGNKIPPQAERKAARTCKKLPVASFCTSERVFAVLFARRKKYQSVPLTGSSRFSKPRFSLPQPHLPTATIKTFYKGSIEVLQTSKQHTQTTNSCNPIKSFRRPWRLFFPLAAVFPYGNIRGFANLDSAHRSRGALFPWRRLCIDTAPGI